MTGLAIRRLRGPRGQPRLQLRHTLGREGHDADLDWSIRDRLDRLIPDRPIPDLALGIQVAAPPGAAGEKQPTEPLIALGPLGGVGLRDAPPHGTTNRLGHRTESQHDHQSLRWLTPRSVAPAGPSGSTMVHRLRSTEFIPAGEGRARRGAKGRRPRARTFASTGRSSAQPLIRDHIMTEFLRPLEPTRRRCSVARVLGLLLQNTGPATVRLDCVQRGPLKPRV